MIRVPKHVNQLILCSLETSIDASEVAEWSVGLTRHGNPSHGVDHKWKEKVVDITFELEGPLDEEETAAKEEEGVEDGQREQEVVEQVPLLHRHDRDEAQKVACKNKGIRGCVNCVDPTGSLKRNVIYSPNFAASSGSETLWMKKKCCPRAFCNENGTDSGQRKARTRPNKG